MMLSSAPGGIGINTVSQELFQRATCTLPALPPHCRPPRANWPFTSPGRPVRPVRLAAIGWPGGREPAAGGQIHSLLRFSAPFPARTDRRHHRHHHQRNKPHLFYTLRQSSSRQAQRCDLLKICLHHTNRKEGTKCTCTTNILSTTNY